MDTSNTPNNQGLSPDEQALMAAYRAGDIRTVVRMASAVVISAAEQPAPEVLPAAPVPAAARENFGPGKQHEVRALKADERLAGFIIGKLMLEHHFTTAIFEGDADGLRLMHQDIAAAIREALPRLDMIELRHIAAGRE